MAEWIALAVLHSVIVFWIPYSLYAPTDGTESAKGVTDGMDVSGLMTFTSLACGMTLKVALEMNSWSWLNHLVIVVSFWV